MTRLVRVVLLVLGLGVVVYLVWHAGPEVVWAMLRRAGWIVPAVAAVDALQVATRAAALWKTMLDDGIRYGDVLRIRFAGEAVETLTFTGPFLAEPAKGWLLTRRGVTTAAAFGAVITEYLLYTFASSCLAIAALWLLLAHHLIPVGLRPGAALVMALTAGFMAACAYASLTGVGLIVPIIRASAPAIGRERAERAALDFARVEKLIVEFLHGHHRRLGAVLTIEAAAHALLVLEVWMMLGALGFSQSWIDSVLIEGGVKFVSVAFAFVPGQLGASEGVYAWLAATIGLPAAAGLSIALVRRLRGLLVATVGVLVVTIVGDQ